VTGKKVCGELLESHSFLLLLLRVYSDSGDLIPSLLRHSIHGDWTITARPPQHHDRLTERYTITPRSDVVRRGTSMFVFGLDMGGGNGGVGMQAGGEYCREGGSGTTSDGRKTSRAHRTRRRRRRAPQCFSTTTAACALLAASLPATTAQSCISLSDSTQCPAFTSASISTNSNLTGLFPFLSSVTDTQSFDDGLKAYINNEFAQLRYLCPCYLREVVSLT